MDLVPSLLVWAVALLIAVCGARAAIGDVRQRRWLWALAGTLATLAGVAALALLVLYTGLLRG